MTRSRETEEAIAILVKAGAREATPEEYAREAGVTTAHFRLGDQMKLRRSSRCKQSPSEARKRLWKRLVRLGAPESKST
jgi:copper homeostasis protein CutC